MLFRRQLTPITACPAALLLVGAPLQAVEVIVGDDTLQIRLSIEDGHLQEAGIVTTGEALRGMAGRPWSIRVDGATIDAGAARRELDSSVAPVVFVGENERFAWRLTYRSSGAGRITKSLTLRSKRDQLLQGVQLWDAASASEPVVSRTGLQDIAAFYRDGPRGLFVSLDYPYSRIEVNGGRTRVSYPPHRRLKPDEEITCHSLTLGATRLAGRARYGFDEGEVEAMDRYVQEHRRPRFERPMLVSCSINNRYTQVRDGVVFYTMKDHPTLRDNTALLERELALMPRLGVEYYQVFPGIFDWAPGDPSHAEVDRLMDVARGHGVRMGDYSGASSVFCFHYNEHGNRLERPEWLIRGSDGKAGGVFCFGAPGFVEHYARTVADNCRRFGFEIHCLDFLAIQPCHADDHGHPPGADSIYAQVRGLVEVLEAINATSPQMMTWSNSGNFGELLPKLAWFNPNLYLTDPFIATPWQGLNMTGLLDDARREQMVSLHHTRFIPYRFLTNCQYFFSQNSIVPDLREYAYGALSTLAVTPNLCLGEIRPWLDRLPEAQREDVIAFYRKWTRFVSDHFGLWTRTYQVGENPGPGAVEIYAHADGSHGFVFVVNPNYWERTVEVPLDTRLGFAGEAVCDVQELHPVEHRRLTPQGTTVALGSSLPVRAGAREVVVLEIRPAAPVTTPRLYGVPGVVERTEAGYRVRTHGPQGTPARVAVVVPDSMPAPTDARVIQDMPRRPARYRDPTPLSVAGAHDRTLVMDLTFRRMPAPTELREWQARAGSLEEGLRNGWQKTLTGERLRFPLFVDVSDPSLALPMDPAQADRCGLGPLANFCGAYIENAFSEEQETWLELSTSSEHAPATTRPACTETLPASAPMHVLARDPRGSWWLRTEFQLPFMYTIGAEPFFDEHTLLVLPLLRAERCKSLSAWINGAPLDVNVYRYPRNRALACRWADLVGSSVAAGANTLVIHLQY